MRPLTIVRRGAGALHFAKQVRPDLGFGDDDHARAAASAAPAAPRTRNRPAHRRRRPRAAQFLGGGGPAGERRGGDEEPAVRGIPRAGAGRIPGTPELLPPKLHATRWRPGPVCLNERGRKPKRCGRDASSRGSAGRERGNRIAGQAAQTPEGLGRGNRCLLFSNVWLYS